MGKTVLFSPVGGTDPIAEKNIHDGSLLHICRVYKADEVVMYLSKEMLEKHHQDNRYVESLEKLAKHQERHIEYSIIERPELSSVQRFDYFYQDFHEVLSDVVSGLEEEDRLLINISSGTPAMKSALVVLCTLGEIPATMVQVSTPERKINEHIHSKIYDLDTLWELNGDNEDPFINRCEEVHCPTLSDMIKKEMIRKHIGVYDYQAALEIAKTLNDKSVILLQTLHMAADRYLLMKPSVDQYIRDGVDFVLPVRDGKYRDCFEYALVMDLKLRRMEYADFMRSITPLVADLFELILEEQCHIKLKDYTWIDMHKVRKWDKSKLRDTDILDILNRAYENNEGFNGKYIYSEHLMYIICEKAQNKHLHELITKIHSVETNCRNRTAHEIMSVTDTVIHEMTGFTGAQIMKMLRQLFNYTGLKTEEDFWDSYDNMNDMILQLLDQ